MVGTGFQILLAGTVILMGLYAVIFKNDTAVWMAGIGEQVDSSGLNEKLYRAGFAVLGFFLIAYGALMILLIA